MMNVKCLEFNFLPVNTYIIWDETKEAAVIDPGCYYPDESAQLAAFIKDNGLDVKLLLNTHLHFDHVFGNSFVEETYGVRARANSLDTPWIENIQQRLAVFGLRYQGHVNPILPQNVLNEGDTVTFGTTTLHVLHIPGHSPGSIVFWNKEQGCVFTGDVMFQGSYGRTDFPDGDYDALMTGIRSKLLTMPDDTVVYPGHGPATTIRHEKLYYPQI
jgi:glyoxylase-like metal-dependent hydrolase (beta-lactamase superfamily II)